jgi:hypothetical protein
VTNTLIHLTPDGPAGLQPCSVVPADALLAGSPQPVEQGVVLLEDGPTTIGIWEASPYRERFQDYPFHEVAQVISGRLTITPDGGAPRHFGPGDSYVMERGFCGTFEVTETMRKYYMTVA